MDQIEPDFHPIETDNVETAFIADSNIEVIDGFTPKLKPKFVLFDFDGTLSLVREGWMDIMIKMMVSELKATATGESNTQLQSLCRTFVAELTGKQTIYQMIRLTEEIKRRNGNPLKPLEYKHKYHDLLMQQIQSRRDGLADGSVPRERYLVPGSVQLLNLLRQQGCQMYLASGTDENYVREEVELLGLSEFFGNHIYGAMDDYQSFSKAQVIQRIIEEHSVSGESLVGFGDGYVEIQNVREAGGIAYGVATDETHRSGNPDEWKRRRLIGAGAHFLVPDFSQAERIVDSLFSIPE